MGQIAFWGNVEGQTGTTSNVIAVSSLIGMEYSIRTLVTQTHYAESTLETAFFKALKVYDPLHTELNDSGLDALDRLVRSARLTPEAVRDYSFSIIRDRLDLLSGTGKPDKLLYHSFRETLQPIFEQALKYYNAVLVDVDSGCDNSITNQVLQQSDVIVVCLNQNMRVLDRFFAKEDWPEALHEKPYIIVLGQYDPHSKYKATNISRKYGVQAPIYTVPYCTSFRDACNDRDARQYFLRVQQQTKDEEAAFFMKEVRKLSKCLLSEIGVNPSIKHIERGAS